MYVHTCFKPYYYLFINHTTTIATTTTTTTTETTTEDPRSTELAPAFTVYGEPCRDACVSRGFDYTWCNKRRLSKIGTWSDSDHCSPRSNITSTGIQFFYDDNMVF